MTGPPDPLPDRLARAWTDEMARRQEGLVALRRDLHRHPELSFEEHRTFEGSGCPAVVNHAGPAAFVHQRAAAELGAEAVAGRGPVMASDDMSLFLLARPGCYFRVGIGPEGRPRPHHAPEFEMDEAGLPVGLRVGLRVMLDALGGER